jgi:protein-disulfide isomerase
MKMPASTKAQRTAKAKAKAQRDAQQSIIGIAAVVIIVFVALVIALVSQARNNNPVPQGNYAGIPQSTTSDGAPILGDPKAKIMIMEILDFSCPHCADYHPIVQQLIGDYVKPGKAQLIVRPVTFVGGQYSQIAATGALCAGKQGAFWPMHDTLFNIAQTEGPQSFSVARMHTAAGTLNLDLTAFDKCMISGDTQVTLDTTNQLIDQLGANSTPSVLYSLDGGKTFQLWPAPGQPDQHAHGGVDPETIGQTILQANA